MTSRLCVPSTAFAALVSDEICGLDHTFTFPRFPLVSGACQLVSTPSQDCSWAWLGIAFIQVPPNLTGYLPAGFPTGRPTLSLASYRAAPPRDIYRFCCTGTIL